MMIPLGIDQFRHLVEHIFATEADEIDCDTCFTKLDWYAEMTLAGQDAAHLMPQVDAHLRHCSACREEYEALLSALKATS